MSKIEEQSAAVEPQLLTSAVSAGGERLDQYVSGIWPAISRSQAQKLIVAPEDSAHGVWVNGRRERTSYRMRAGDTVTLSVPPAAPMRAEPEAIPLSILHEDADLLVIDKPRGMVVHPAPGSRTGTLVNALLGHTTRLSGASGEFRPGIVHRLDKDTGGLLLVARTDEAHRRLQTAIQAREVQRIYTAVAWGSPSFDVALVDAPIGRHPLDRKRMAVLAGGRATSRTAQTELRVLQRFGDLACVVEARLRTGRTHQIRVHCAHAGLPIAGDPVYGVGRPVPGGIAGAERTTLEAAVEALHGQALHAGRLEFNHPRTGQRMEFASPLPTEMQELIEALRLIRC